MESTIQTSTINTSLTPDEFIAHHGIIGMKWGIRRFQNKDGSLKAAGNKRYNNSEKTRDTGLAPGTQNNASVSGSRGLTKLAAAAGIAALAGLTASATKHALGQKSYKDMSDKELSEANKRKKLENTYKKQHGIKDSFPDAMDSASKGLEAVQKYRNADKPQINTNQNRYNTRRTLSQKEMDSMSDQDLQRLVNRMNLETQYSRLTQDPPTRSKVDVGLEKTQAVMTIIGSAVTIGAASYSLYSKAKGSGAASAVSSAWEKANR